MPAPARAASPAISGGRHQRKSGIADRRGLSQALGFCYGSSMPTVLRLGHLRVVIYPNDHRPAHVHVVGGGGEAVFVLNCPNGPPTLRENHGFTGREASRIAQELSAHVAELCRIWRGMHGGF
jgi:hypothetical protein